jgi:hypothetical protein
MAYPFRRLLVRLSSHFAISISNLCELSIINPCTLLGCTSHSCYNAFSRVDVRVEVKIPGGVESYAINVRGER